MFVSISVSESPRQSCVSAVHSAIDRPRSSAISIVHGASIPQGGRHRRGFTFRFLRDWSPLRVSVSISYREVLVCRMCDEQWNSMLCPSWRMLGIRCRYRLAAGVMTKKVAVNAACRKASRIRGVQMGSGPSSKERWTDNRGFSDRARVYSSHESRAGGQRIVFPPGAFSNPSDYSEVGALRSAMCSSLS